MFAFRLRTIAALSLLVLSVPASALLTPDRCAAQGFNKDQPDLTITAEQRAEVIDGALKKLTESYVFPDKAKEMEKAIRARLDKKEFDGITSARELTEMLTNHLQEVSKDKHLRVLFSHDPLPKPKPPSDEDRQRMRARAGKSNYGFE